MRKTVVVCDICGKEIEFFHRPKVTFTSDNRQTAIGLESGDFQLFGDKDLCMDCQEQLRQCVVDAIDGFEKRDAE